MRKKEAKKVNKKLEKKLFFRTINLMKAETTKNFVRVFHNEILTLNVDLKKIRNSFYNLVWIVYVAIQRFCMTFSCYFCSDYTGMICNITNPKVYRTCCKNFYHENKTKCKPRMIAIDASHVLTKHLHWLSFAKLSD